MTQNGSVFIGFGPDTLFVIAKDDRARFGSKRITIGVGLDRQDAVGWNRANAFVFVWSVFSCCEDVEGIFSNKAVVFLGVGCEPGGSIRVLITKRTCQGGRKWRLEGLS